VILTAKAIGRNRGRSRRVSRGSGIRGRARLGVLGHCRRPPGIIPGGMGRSGWDGGDGGSHCMALLAARHNAERLGEV
jgi:hypothetical protein